MKRRRECLQLAMACAFFMPALTYLTIRVLFRSFFVCKHWRSDKATMSAFWYKMHPAGSQGLAFGEQSAEQSCSSTSVLRVDFSSTDSSFVLEVNACCTCTGLHRTRVVAADWPTSNVIMTGRGLSAKLMPQPTVNSCLAFLMALAVIGLHKTQKDSAS